MYNEQSAEEEQYVAFRKDVQSSTLTTYCSNLKKLGLYYAQSSCLEFKLQVGPLGLLITCWGVSQNFSKLQLSGGGSCVSYKVLMWGRSCCA